MTLRELRVRCIGEESIDRPGAAEQGRARFQTDGHSPADPPCPGSR